MLGFGHRLATMPLEAKTADDPNNQPRFLEILSFIKTNQKAQTLCGAGMNRC